MTEARKGFRYVIGGRSALGRNNPDSLAILPLSPNRNGSRPSKPVVVSSNLTRGAWGCSSIG